MPRLPEEVRREAGTGAPTRRRRARCSRLYPHGAGEGDPRRSRRRYRGGVTSDDPFDDFDEEELERELDVWEELDREAADLLRRALAGERGRPPPPAISATADQLRAALSGGGYPFDWVRRAAAFDDELPAGDPELLVRTVAATISPKEETGLDPEEEAAIGTQEHADWLGAVVTVVRGGPGSDASPAALVDGIETCPEVNIEGEIDIDDRSLIEHAFELSTFPWSLVGILDEDRRLTEAGAWVLPRALARAWNSDFDADP